MFPFDPGGELLVENSVSLLDVANQFPFDPGWTSADLTSNVSPIHGARTCQPAPLGDSKGNVSVNSDQVAANDFGKAIDWSRLHRSGAVATPHSLWQRGLQWFLLIGVLIRVASNVNSVMFQDLGADIRNVTTHHPQANGQVERLTAVICDFLSLNIALRMTNNIGIDFWKQLFLLSILE